MEKQLERERRAARGLELDVRACCVRCVVVKAPIQLSKGSVDVLIVSSFLTRGYVSCSVDGYKKTIV